MGIAWTESQRIANEPLKAGLKERNVLSACIRLNKTSGVPRAFHFTARVRRQCSAPVSLASTLTAPAPPVGLALRKARQESAHSIKCRRRVTDRCQSVGAMKL
jgi:hypothetical protein